MKVACVCVKHILHVIITCLADFPYKETYIAMYSKAEDPIWITIYVYF